MFVLQVGPAVMSSLRPGALLAIVSQVNSIELVQFVKSPVQSSVIVAVTGFGVLDMMVLMLVTASATAAHDAAAADRGEGDVSWAGQGPDNMHAGPCAAWALHQGPWHAAAVHLLSNCRGQQTRAARLGGRIAPGEPPHRDLLPLRSPYLRGPAGCASTPGRWSSEQARRQARTARQRGSGVAEGRAICGVNERVIVCFRK